MMLNFTQIGFKQMFFFYTPRNHQETTSYLLFSWSIQKEHKLLISFNFMYSSTAFACLLATSPLWPKYGLKLITPGQSSRHKETVQFISKANQLTGFYVMHKHLLISSTNTAKTFGFQIPRRFFSVPSKMWISFRGLKYS